MTSTLAQLVLLGIALVAILSLALRGSRPGSDGSPTARIPLRSYRKVDAGTPQTLTLFLVCAFADGFAVVTPSRSVGQVGAALGICMALMPSVEITATILACLATLATAIALLHGDEGGTGSILAALSISTTFLVGRFAGRLVLGSSHRRPSEILATALASLGLIRFLGSPAGMGVVGDLPRLGTSTAVALIAGAAFALPGIVIPALVGIGVNITNLLAPEPGAGHQVLVFTFLACAGAAYILVGTAMNLVLPGRRGRVQ